MEKLESIAGIIGDPTRAKILWILLDGRAYTATELAIKADISSSNASMHLAKLIQAELLVVEKQGRHRYYGLSKPEVAYAMEALANLIPENKSDVNNPEQTISETSNIKYCRSCYDHLAGKVAVQISDQLVNKGVLISQPEQFELSDFGIEWFENLGIDIARLRSKKRSFSRKCLDWSERRHHLAGALGAALYEKFQEQNWVQKRNESRVINFTKQGRSFLYEHLDLWI